MSSTIRKKIARSLSEISRPDDWKWNRWLKPPSNSEEEDLKFPMVRVTGKDTDQIFLLYPALENYNFCFVNPRIIHPEQFNKWLTKKSTKEKTSLIVQQKSFRIFISKIKTDVSINLVPKIYSAPLLYSYEPVSGKTLTIEFFYWNETAATEVFQHEFITEPVITEEDVRFYFRIPELSDELFNRYAAFTQDGKNKSQAGKPVLNDVNIFDKFKTQAGKPVLHEYKFVQIQVTANLLSSADAIDTKNICFFINNKIISDDLLSIVPETIDIKLLQTEEFKIENTYSFAPEISSGIINKNYFTVCDTSFINYVAKSKILITQNKSVKVNFCSLSESSVQTFACDLRNLDERLIPFQELNADYINHSYGFDIPGADTENFEVKNNPVLIPHETEYFNDKNTFDGLYNYQKEIVNYLINNVKAVVKYDSLIDYKPQTIFALSLLLRYGKVRCALIVKNTSDVISDKMIKEEEWISAINIWAQEIPYETIANNAGGGKLRPINFTTYNELKNLKLSRFDCIIFDKYNDEHQQSLKLIDTHIQRLWIFADKNTDTPLEYSTTSVTRSKIDEDLSQRYYEYRWVKLNSKQDLEYKTQLAQGQLKISASIDRGEIYIIKPHLFTLLHQLLQTCNFASDESSSSKTDALLQDIKSCSGKVIVLSQYERYGLERIEKLLSAEGIGAASYKTGFSENDKSLQDFRTKENVKVLLADAKAINSQLNTGAVSMIIHFDHWWNPVSQWHIEDRLAGKNPVKIIQYCSENTIEEDIYKKLSERELTDKLIFESLTPTVYSEIITDEEWLKLYNISTEEEYPKPLLIIDTQKKINSLNTDELIIIVQKFISRIGYTNHKSLQHLNDNEIILMHSRMHNKKEENILVYISRNSSIEQNNVRRFFDDYLSHRNVTKAFFITTGKINSSCKSLFNYQSHKISFADGERLGRLLHLFNLI